MTTDFDKVIRAALLEAFNGEITVLGTNNKSRLKLLDNKTRGRMFSYIIATVWFENDQLNLVKGDYFGIQIVALQNLNTISVGQKFFLGEPDAIEQFIEAVRKIRDEQ
jgi:hypothetical protein